MRVKNIAYIGIGSNQGDKLANCKEAISRLGKLRKTRVIASSSFYETEPVGEIEQDWFVNATVKLETSLPAEELFVSLLGIEGQMGRQRTVKGGPRIIDLDLLFYNQEIISQPDLNVPHPQFHTRGFVLTPLNEIAAGEIHPRLNLSVSQLLAGLGDDKVVRKIG
ncbi:MAG: 2-amino-4-hydroxy-6-hydroxymethyldihydropteridine diphosphokinase [Deltaproteobacteria bacterium]|nr:MAG: 2-amino-4-hydroxy-6-hydroxymethyldihydropteridine diphosphokinase [Deltaproteobacteria bacterium]